MAQNQLVVGSCLQITKDALKSMLVVRPGSCGVAAKHCNSVS